VQTRLYIGGEFVDGLAGGTIEVINPADGTVLALVAEARAEDIDRAVQAAQQAFPGWAATPAADRGRLLLALADAIEANAADLARLESLDTGHPIRDTSRLDVPRTAAAYRYFGGIADKHEGSVVPVERGFLNYVLREPLGVAGSIVPWNFPLMFTSWKLGPALAAGNTTVLKAAELTPMSSLRLAEIIAETGFPPGVVNIVPGYGHTAGARLAEHPGVAKLSFTGSTQTGRSSTTRDRPASPVPGCCCTSRSPMSSSAPSSASLPVSGSGPRSTPRRRWARSPPPRTGTGCWTT